MTISTRFRYSLIFLLLASLGACSSSDSVNVGPDDTANADNPGEQSPAEPDAEVPLTDTITNPGDETITPVDDETITPVDNEPDEPTDESPSDTGEPPTLPDNTDTDTPSPAGDDDQDNQTPVEEDDPEPTAEEPSGTITPPTPPGSVSDSEQTTDTNEPNQNDGILMPSIMPGSDLDRLVKGLTQQVSTTLLSLNGRISEGVALTDIEDECLGSYEEGLGQQLTRIDCGENVLVNEATLISIGEAAFYDTEECQASLFDKDSEDCVLQRLRLTIPARWDSRAGGVPRLAYPGAEVAYAVDNTLLQLDNIGTELQGIFSCEINLESANLEDSSVARNCANIVNLMADEIEFLQDK